MRRRLRVPAGRRLLVRGGALPPADDRPFQRLSLSRLSAKGRAQYPPLNRPGLRRGRKDRGGRNPTKRARRIRACIESHARNGSRRVHSIQYLSRFDPNTLRTRCRELMRPAGLAGYRNRGWGTGHASNGRNDHHQFRQSSGDIARICRDGGGDADGGAGSNGAGDDRPAGDGAPARPIARRPDPPGPLLLDHDRQSRPRILAALRRAHFAPRDRP